MFVSRKICYIGQADGFFIKLALMHGGTHKRISTVFVSDHCISFRVSIPDIQ